MNGDEIRNTTFSGGSGYDAAQVDDLLRRIVAEIDASRPIEPLIETARFQTRGKRRYDTDAVDWFLDDLLHRERHPEKAGTSGDPWRDLGVVTQFPRRERHDLAGTCTGEWDEFDQQPGTHLRWRWARYGSSRRELSTAEQQPLASL